MQQSTRYLKTADGVRLAWAVTGEGPPLVKAANWLSHLDYDAESPLWRHWHRFFADHFRYVRYDERGCGMTEWRVSNLSLDHWVDDLEAVVGQSRPDEPFVLLGISQAAAVAVAYAVRHPERVSRLILYGGYAAGWARREDREGLYGYHAIADLIRLGWSKDNPVFRQVFTARFIPEGTVEQIEWFNELCRRTTTPEMAAQLMQARGEVDVTELLPNVMAPTLVVHARHDEVVPFSQGQLLASEIPGAEFVQIDSRNHILLEDEPGWQRFMDAVLEFTGRAASTGAEDPRFDALSDREREILGGVVAGQSNTEIGARLFISEKTVRNSLTRIYEKLRVSTRAQAMVLAREGGFRG